MLTLEITSIKNMRLFLEIAERLGYEEGKVKLVLNRADGNLGIRVADVEHSIGRKVDYTIVSDGRSVVYALNRGIPFVLTNKEAQVSQDVLQSGPRGRRRAAADRERRSSQAGAAEVPLRMALNTRARLTARKGSSRCPS